MGIATCAPYRDRYSIIAHLDALVLPPSTCYALEDHRLSGLDVFRRRFDTVGSPLVLSDIRKNSRNEAGPVKLSCSGGSGQQSAGIRAIASAKEFRYMIRADPLLNRMLASLCQHSPVIGSRSCATAIIPWRRGATEPRSRLSPWRSLEP